MLTEGAALWKEEGCDAKQFEQLGAWDGAVTRGVRSVVFICRPSIPRMKEIAAIVRRKPDETETQYALYCVPRCTFICQQILRDEGLTTGEFDADLVVGNLELDMVPFEADVISFEIPGVMRDSCLDSDVTALSFVSQGVLRLESKFGAINHLVGKGDLSKRTIEMICRLRAEAEGGSGKSGGGIGMAAEDAAGSGGEGGDGSKGSIDTLLVIDRIVDLVSPLVTPLTYEGLLDEIMGIEAGQVQVTKAILGEEDDDDDEPAAARSRADGTEEKKRYRALNSSDKLYSFLRDMNIASCAPYLQEKSREVQALYNQRPTDTGQSVQKLRDFVKKIPELKEMCVVRDRAPPRALPRAAAPSVLTPLSPPPFPAALRSPLRHRYASVQVHTSLVGIVHQTTNSKRFRDRWNLEHSMMDGETSGLAAAEEACARQEPLVDVLRLLCLNCVMSGGLKTRDFDRVRRDLLQTYGSVLSFLLLPLLFFCLLIYLFICTIYLT